MPHDLYVFWCGALLGGIVIAGIWQLALWRNLRSDSDTRPKDGDAKQGSTRE